MSIDFPRGLQITNQMRREKEGVMEGITIVQLGCIEKDGNWTD